MFTLKFKGQFYAGQSHFTFIESDIVTFKSEKAAQKQLDVLMAYCAEWAKLVTIVPIL